MYGYFNHIQHARQPGPYGYDPSVYGRKTGETVQRPVGYYGDDYRTPFCVGHQWSAAVPETA